MKQFWTEFLGLKMACSVIEKFILINHAVQVGAGVSVTVGLALGVKVAVSVGVSVDVEVLIAVRVGANVKFDAFVEDAISVGVSPIGGIVGVKMGWTHPAMSISSKPAQAIIHTRILDRNDGVLFLVFTDNPSCLL
jgi:hypothetical protein